MDGLVLVVESLDRLSERRLAAAEVGEDRRALHLVVLGEGPALGLTVSTQRPVIGADCHGLHGVLRDADVGRAAAHLIENAEHLKHLGAVHVVNVF